jgi:hypothetical protein
MIVLLGLMVAKRAGIRAPFVTDSSPSDGT